MKRLKNLKKTDGQAITEFVIALPTMLVIFVFSQYFYEAWQVKLKTQEMARYMAWEFTGYALHDYGDGKMKYSSVKSEIVSDAKKRFSNMKSSDKHNNADTAFAGKWSIKRVRTRDNKEPRIPGGKVAGIDVNTILSVLGYALDAWRVASIANSTTNFVWASMVAWYSVEKNSFFNDDDEDLVGGGGMNVFNPPSEWKFNNRGYVRTEVTVSFENVFISQGILSKGNWFAEDMHLRRLDFKEHYVLLADSWRLNYGEDVNGPSSSETPYYKQLSRMAFLTKRVRDILGFWLNMIKAGSNTIAYMAFQPTLGMNKLDEVALVSKNYKGDGTSGKIDIDEDSGKKTYDTSPYYNQGEHTGDQSYVKTLDIRGEHYMACPEQESMGCTSSLSTENPFGEYIIPQELEE